MKSSKKLVVITAVTMIAGLAFEAKAATYTESAVGKALLRIVEKLTIVAKREMKFTEVAQGTNSTETIAPLVTDLRSAQFDVTGMALKMVTIVSVADHIDLIKLDAQGAPIGTPGQYQKLTITDVLTSGSAPTLADGKLSIFVGGTRPIVPLLQEGGSYEGSFTLTVSQTN